MKHSLYLIILPFCLLFSLLASAQSANSGDSITIKTYYPTPQGVYNTLRLYPRNSPPAAGQPGEIYFNDGTGTEAEGLYLYANDTVKWVPYVGTTTNPGTNPPPPPSTKNVITLSGSNPVCPAGYTTMAYYWVGGTVHTCYSSTGNSLGSVSLPSTWSATAPWGKTGCSIYWVSCSNPTNSPPANCGRYYYGSNPWNGDCQCSLSTWNMVMCESPD